MREPTPRIKLYAYWHYSLKKPGSRRTLANDPQAGFYRIKHVKDGPWLPVAIWVVQETEAETGELIADEHFACLVNGEEAQAGEIWTWCWNRPIKQDAYNHRIKYGEWATKRAPERPAANPSQPIDLLTIEPSF